MHHPVARARFALQNFKQLRRSEHFWKMRSVKCAPHCSESSVSHKSRKNAMLGVARNRPHCQRCANVGRFGATLLLRGFATGCDKSHWHGCAQQSMSDAATLLGAIAV